MCSILCEMDMINLGGITIRLTSLYFFLLDLNNIKIKVNS